MSFHSFAVEVAPEAQDDINSIAAYTVEQWGDQIAERYLTDLHESLDRLSALPNLGRPLTENESDLRRLFSGQHVIYYQIRQARRYVTVLRILHARMDPTGQLPEF